MARMSPEERRAAIVAATRAVMARRGIAGTTVRDVAAELGTSSGLIHHYYASMDDLLAEAFEQAARADLVEVLEGLSQGGNAVERLAIFFDTYDRGIRDGSGDFGMQIWLDAWAEASRRPALRRTSRRLNEEWQRALADVIGQGVDDGVMQCDDPDASAWRILSLLDGLILQVVAHGDVLSREQADAWSRDAAERELRLRPGALSRAVSVGGG
ncbi:MAG: TetR family transcriptional regulator [Actinobacteria bacterium]|nr:TetR family transcriptional regulator [Actinomycetota bacterium]